MEKLFFKKVELWFVLLLVLLGAVGTILFGAIVRNEAEGYGRFGRVGEFVFAVASLPADVEDALSFAEDSWMSVGGPSFFEGRTGWTFADAGPDGRPDGYILFSRYDGDIARHVFELVDLKTGTVEHRVVLNSDDFFKDWTPSEKNDIATPWIASRFRGIHPYMLPDGDLLVKDHHSPLVRLTACGDLVWRNDETLFHHSLEPGPDGGFWIPLKVPLAAFGGMDAEFGNMGLGKVDADGNLLYARSFGDVLVEHGMEYLIVDVNDFDANPMHLNDIQPVFEDGPHWKRGDLFLSFRSMSAIVLFRPSTDEIVWMKQGPWRAQHDVDIVDDHTIAVFNNDVINTGDRARVRAANRVTFYDFDTGDTRGPYDEALAAANVRALFGGLFELLPGGHLMVEETSNGRLLILDRTGRVVAENVNRAKDGKVYFLGWSRYMDRAAGDRARDAARAAGCAT